MQFYSLIVGAGLLDRIIPNVELFQRLYREDTGYLYQGYQSITSPDRILPEDLAVTLLVNSQVGWKAFQSLHESGETIRFAHLPDKSLDQTTQEERKQVSAVIAKLANLPRFATFVPIRCCKKAASVNPNPG